MPDDNKPTWAYPIRVPVAPESAAAIESVHGTNPTDVSRAVVTRLFGADANDRVTRIMGSIARAAVRGVSLDVDRADAEDRAFQRVTKLQSLVAVKKELGLPMTAVEASAIAAAEKAYTAAIAPPAAPESAQAPISPDDDE